MRFIVAAAAAAMTILIPAAPAAADPLAGEPDNPLCPIIVGTPNVGDLLGGLFKCPEKNGSGEDGEAGLRE
ncbi:hypothetical protein [Nonomuraea dietziae]|uniref:hypothetical protein n=1 Tax=Nonomuraea dietziae TaxID=65515 RepID=UPI0033EFD564